MTNLVPSRFAESSSENEKSFNVTEADLLRWIRVLLPALNLALRKAREVFSGDPATTLRVSFSNLQRHSSASA